MSDLDLRDALECSSPDLSEEVASETSCGDMTDIQEGTLRLEDGLEMVVSKCPNLLWRTATVLLAANRIKKVLACGGKDHKGDMLWSAILESTVEETIVNFCTKANRFQRADSETDCTLCDIAQKSIVLGSGGTELHAVTLKAGQENYTVKFRLSRFDPRSRMNGQVVQLSISNYNLSCSMCQNEAILTVEPCQDLSRINEDASLHRFLFCKTIGEADRVSFESVSCPGWFICTNFEANRAVEMCKKEDAKRFTTFIMNPKELLD